MKDVTPGAKYTFIGKINIPASNLQFQSPAGTTNAQVMIVVSSLNRTIYVDQFVFKR